MNSIYPIYQKIRTFFSFNNKIKKPIDKLDERLQLLAHKLKEFERNTNLSENKFMNLSCKWSTVDSQIIGLKGQKNSVSDQTENMKDTLTYVNENIDAFRYHLGKAVKSSEIGEKVERSASSSKANKYFYNKNHIPPRLDPGEKKWLQSGHINAAMNHLEEIFPYFKAFTADGCDHDSILYKDVLNLNLVQLLLEKGPEQDPLGGKDTRQIAFPVNLDRGHWVIAMANIYTHTISYYNSFGSKIDSRIKPRLQQIQNFMKQRQFILTEDNTDWKIVSVEGAPQKDGWSCGDHAIWFAEESLLTKGNKKISTGKINVTEAREKLRIYIKNNYFLSETGTLMKKNR